jgi:hypothetical protein
LKSQQWAEIFNGGTGPVTLAGWTIAGADGSNDATARSLPSVTLAAGAYLVVHFTSGQNQLDFTKGSGDFYTGDSSSYWSIDADAVALYGPSGIVDFLSWKRGTATFRARLYDKDTSWVVPSHEFHLSLSRVVRSTCLGRLAEGFRGGKPSLPRSVIIPRNLPVGQIRLQTLESII